MARGVAAREYPAMPYNEWRKKVGYRHRWKSECTFSNFKRIISKTMSAITDSRISLEMFPKTMSFNFYKDLCAQVLEKTGNRVVVRGN